MKQTAVEWFFNALIENQDKTHKQIESIFQQAKEMEKEQIKNAWIATDNELQRIAAEEYYNRTYNI
jgi:hypothetical protein